MFLSCRRLKSQGNCRGQSGASVHLERRYVVRFEIQSSTSLRQGCISVLTWACLWWLGAEVLVEVTLNPAIVQLSLFVRPPFEKPLEIRMRREYEHGPAIQAGK